MSTKTADPQVSPDRLINIIRTGQPSPEGIGRIRAMAALRNTPSTHRLEVFSSVFADRREPPRFRNLAITGLLELGGVQAERALLDNVTHADASTAPALALALGRIGSPGSAAAISSLERAAPAALQGHARFAASLLAYRHNLDGGEITPPASNRLLAIEAGERALPVEVAASRRGDFDLALAALRRDPVGVDLGPDHSIQLQCGPNTFLMVWTRDFGGPAFNMHRDHKRVAGVLFRKSRFENEYSVSSVVLTTPTRRDVKLTVHKLSGDTAYSGTVTFPRGQPAALEVRAVRRPGATAVEFTGSIDGGQLSVQAARSVDAALDRRAPRPAGDG